MRKGAVVLKSLHSRGGGRLSLNYRHGQQARLDFYEVSFVVNDRFDVLVRTRSLLHIVLAANGMYNAKRFQARHLLVQVEVVDCCRSRHQTAGAV